MRHIQLIATLLLLTLSSLSFAKVTWHPNPPARPLFTPCSCTAITPVEERIIKEKTLCPNYFFLTAYKPNYALPVYYTASPDSSVFAISNPSVLPIQQVEIKFQISLKAPLWKNIYCYPSTLYLGYTQQSYVQLYRYEGFVRDTDYEPELFLANELNWQLPCGWHLNFFNIGADHQSNGMGGSMERSWNRLYVEAIGSWGNWMVDFKPWYVVNDNFTQEHNPSIPYYLGYSEAIVAYKINCNVFSLRARNVLESAGRRSTVELSWSFPISHYIKGYAQFFSGYGQSLIEYNHRTNAAGVGIALTDWV